jgi:adenine-specific DNA-methyltransferase
LDFYLKNEVLALDDLASGGEARANGWFQLLEAMRVVGGKIIAFLAQIENFQKRIFEKRKFVTETNYCFTLDRVPKALKPKILKNKAQIEEWKKLYSVQDLKGYSDPLKPAFLESWPSLIMDTRYFANDIEFMDTLLAAQKDLEESLDGLLVNSENFQALNFVFARYRNSLNTVYIDPPYNTDASSILYKNDYKHSSWMSLIENRLTLSSRLMTNTGILCCAIDDEELTEARHILGQFFPKQLGIAVVRSNPQSRKAKGKFSPVHEYALFYGKSEDSTPGSLELTEKRIARYPKQDEQGRFAWMNLIRTGTNDKRMDRPKLYYPIFVADDDTPRIPQMSWSDDAGEYGEYILHETAKQNETVVYPIDETEDGPIEKNWHRGYKRILAEPDEYRVRRDAKGKINIDFKTRIDEHSTPVTWWDNNEYASANYGAVELKGLFGAKPFDFPKALNLVADCLRAANTRFNSVVLDYFAGSGTTGHAVINLNREDGGRRKYILIEMGEYFDAVLIARMKKVVFCPHWRDGKPVPPDEHKSTGLSHAFKYFRLESYEDALGNMFSGPQGNLKFDDYVLQYILGFETRKSETLLNVEKLTAPFLYKLDIMEGGERKTKPVDLPETFNYLLGLKVHSREVHRRDGKHRYLVFRGTSNPYGEGGERKLCVIWRDVSEWKSADFKADAEFVKKEKLADGADDVFVNADSVIPGARVLDSVFKERMFMPVAV